MKKILLAVSMLAFAAACGGDSDPTGLTPDVASAPSAPNLHSGGGNNGTAHNDIAPAGITAPTWTR